MAVMLHVERGWKWPYVAVGAFCLLSAYARMYLGVHWPSDVIGGVIVGVLWFWACYKAFRSAPGVTMSGLPRSRPAA
jgi:membrane-associated phospholipid phosphatase